MRLKRVCCNCGDDIQRNVATGIRQVSTQTVFCLCLLCMENGFASDDELVKQKCKRHRTKTRTNYLTEGEFINEGMRTSDRRGSV